MADSIQMGIPGGNPSGNQNAVPGVGGSASPAIGSQVNPLTPPVPTGTKMPSSSDPLQMLLTGQGGAFTTPGASNTSSNWIPNEHDFIKAMHKGGFSAGDAALLWQFIQSGAGYNPAVAKAMIASMQPGIERGQADILEQFGGMGNRYGSAAAIGMGDYMGQVALDEGQILAQLYEQSVQNYLEVLLAGKKQPGGGGGLGALIGGAGSAASGIAALAGL